MPLLTPAGEWRSLAALLLFLGLCYGAAALGGLATATSVESWYPLLRKPDFTPPDWAFPVVWNILYGLIALSAWRVWRLEERPRARRWALVWFGVQLVLNVAWSFAFFWQRDPLLGLVTILALDAVLLVLLVRFALLDGIATALILPYILWVGFATALNGAIVTLN